MNRKAKYGWTLFSLLLGMTLGGGYVYANHPWICSGNTAYHFPSGSISLTRPVQEGAISRNGSDYLNAYKNGAIEWHTEAEPPLALFIDFGNPDVEPFYGNYGNNGWLGLAQIFISGCVINRGEAFLNDFYLSSEFQYSQTNLDHVACQEVGHCWGLDHNRSANNTCMNDFILTAGAQINAHDIEVLEDIY